MSQLTCYLVTGLSGAGKSHALQAFEDAGIHCVDNLPADLVEPFVDHFLEHDKGKRVALILDVREENFVTQFPELVGVIEAKNVELKVIFLDATDEEILRRYRESRRPHPLAEDRDLENSIQVERQRLAPVREKADLILDTTRINIHQLKQRIFDLCRTSGARDFIVFLTSFGFKNGTPAHLDFLFDVRFLPNPHYEAELREKTGLDDEVIQYMRESSETDSYMDKLIGVLSFVLDSYHPSDKLGLSVGVGCTGGRHRSVYLVEQLADHFETCEKMSTSVTHRDLM